MGAAVAGPASSILGAGLQVAGALGQGQASKVESQIKGIQLHMQAEAAKVRGVQTSAQYQQNFAEGLSTFMAIRAGQGAGVDSATSRELVDKAESRSETARLTAVSNANIAALTAEGDSTAAFQAGRRAMMASYLQAGAAGAKGLGSIFSLGSSAFG